MKSERECRGERQMYLNRMTGELLTRKEMLRQFAEDYDGGDSTNVLSWAEYFEEVRT